MRRHAVMLAAILLVSCNQSGEGDNRTAAAPANEAASPASAPRATTANPSFDCARADGQAQEMVCTDPDLAGMDRELDRLFRLAAADPQQSAEARQTLVATQRGWVKGRDDCWKDDDLHQCVLGAYAERIHRLRQQSAAARAASDDARSIGPIAFRCDGLNGDVAATFVNSDPGAVFLEWGPQDSVALAQGPSGSGARYESRIAGQDWVFWNKGRGATFSMPGRGDLTCVEADGDQG